MSNTTKKFQDDLYNRKKTGPFLALKATIIERQQGYILGLVAVLAILAGSIQNIILTYFPVGPGQIIDDFLVVLLASLSVFRWGRAKALPLFLVVLWSSILGLAFYHTQVTGSLDGGDTFVLFRQVFIPSALILIGMVITPREWKIIAGSTIVVGIVNAIYCVVEFFGVRIIDPAPLGHFHKVYVAMDGLPGYYHGIWLDGTPFVRSGGLLLNPPTAGILIALAATMAFFVIRGLWRIPLTFILIAAVGMTGSRAGMLIALLGIALPILTHRFGNIVASILILGTVFFTGFNVLDQGGSASHVDGLFGGIFDAINYPFGRGFGYNGNHADSLGLTESSESLLGIAFSAGGIICVFIILLLLIREFLGHFSQPSRWIFALGIGGVIAALLSETAGAVNGTIPLWIFIGYGFSMSSYPLYLPSKVEV